MRILPTFTAIFLKRISLDDDLVETSPRHLFFIYFFFRIAVLCVLLLLLYFFNFAVGLHVPEAGLLVVISAEIDDILDKIYNEIVLNRLKTTLVGLIKFWIFSLKLNIYSYLLKKVLYIPTKSLRKLSSKRSKLISYSNSGLICRII